MRILRLTPDAIEFIKARGIGVGPKGGRFYVGSEKKDAKGRTTRAYVGSKTPGESRWSPEVRETHDSRDKRLPPVGHVLSRVYQGKHVQVTEIAGGGFNVSVDGVHSGTGRSLTGALSAALKKPVSGYSFMRLGSAWDPAPARDWADYGRIAGNMASDVRFRAGKAARIVVEHQKNEGMRAHVFVNGAHFIIMGSKTGYIEAVHRQDGEGRGAKYTTTNLRELADAGKDAEKTAPPKPSASAAPSATIELRQGIGYTGKLGGKAYVAAITGTDDDYGFARDFVDADKVERDHFGRARYIRTLTYSLDDGLYEVSSEGEKQFRISTTGASGKRLWFQIDSDRATRIAKLMDEGATFDEARSQTKKV